MSIMCFFYLI